MELYKSGMEHRVKRQCSVVVAHCRALWFCVSVGVVVVVAP